MGKNFNERSYDLYESPCEKKIIVKEKESGQNEYMSHQEKKRFPNTNTPKKIQEDTSKDIAQNIA